MIGMIARHTTSINKPTHNRGFIADLHGHFNLFERLLARFDAQLPGAGFVTLGDYVDNGPDIPALLERRSR